jgi:hypothetical protein
MVARKLTIKKVSCVAATVKKIWCLIANTVAPPELVLLSSFSINHTIAALRLPFAERNLLQRSPLDNSAPAHYIIKPFWL